MEKALENIEKLKDADREIVYKNGNGDLLMIESVVALLMFVNGEIKEQPIPRKHGKMFAW